ncbi:hypothetical protein [Streptomyces sp.]|uniref:hypothetical protein n=1 Tax=Streptomyces sp. TaxID=1931 RepID=UPI002F91C26A
MTPRGGRPKQGKEGERAMSNAERKLQRGKQPKGKSELPGLTIRRGRREGA